MEISMLISAIHLSYELLIMTIAQMMDGKSINSVPGFTFMKQSVDSLTIIDNVWDKHVTIPTTLT